MLERFLDARLTELLRVLREGEHVAYAVADGRPGSRRELFEDRSQQVVIDPRTLPPHDLFLELHRRLHDLDLGLEPALDVARELVDARIVVHGDAEAEVGMGSDLHTRDRALDVTTIVHER